MEGFEDNVRRLLRGEAVPVPHVDVRVPDAESFMPITKVNMCYIACGVLINEKNEILMMQEAKPSCHGSWYLPAGRVEPAENLVTGQYYCHTFQGGMVSIPAVLAEVHRGSDAAIREVKEETGLECEPTTLIMVEFGSGTWHRFTFTGRVTGGCLKTPLEKDAESIQARWMSMETIQSSETELRAFDILKLIKCGQKYYNQSVEDRLPDTVPAIQEHDIVMIRLVVVLKSATQKAKYLLNTKNGLHFPVGMVSPRDRSCVFCCFRVLKDAFLKLGDPPQVCGLLSVEHCGIPQGEHDGLCYTLVLSYSDLGEDQSPQINMIKNPEYQWMSLEDDSLHEELLTRISKKRLVSFVDLQSSWSHCT